MGLFGKIKEKVKEKAKSGYDIAKKEAKFRYALKKAEYKQNMLDKRRNKSLEITAYKEAKQKEMIRQAKIRGRNDAKRPRITTIFGNANKEQGLKIIKSNTTKRKKGKSPLDNDYFL